MPCDYKLGCHECCNRLMLLHACIRQYLREPHKNEDKLKAEALGIKRLIEDIVGVQPKEEA